MSTAEDALNEEKDREEMGKLLREINQGAKETRLGKLKKLLFMFTRVTVQVWWAVRIISLVFLILFFKMFPR